MSLMRYRQLIHRLASWTYLHILVGAAAIVSRIAANNEGLMSKEQPTGQISKVLLVFPWV